MSTDPHGVLPGEDEVVSMARQIVTLIEPLGEVEQHAALEMADTLRAYRRITRSEAERVSPGESAAPV